MTSPEHMKRYLEAAGKKFLILNALDLVDALSWPEGVEVSQQLVSGYRDHRQAIPTGFEVLVTEENAKGVNLKGTYVPEFYGETLTEREALEAIQQLKRHVVALRAEATRRPVGER